MAKVRGLSDILTYFRRNEKPIFFVSPTPFNLLGVEKFINRFYHVNYFDSFDSQHPRVFVPTEKSHAEFESMEDVCNYMLQHKEVIDRIRKAGKGPAKLLFVMLDEKTEEICKELGVDIALPPVELRNRLDSKIELTKLANKAGIDSAPNVLGKADSYEELMKAASKGGLGNDLVVQTPYGDSGRTTFFIKAEADWDKNAEDMKGVSKKLRPTRAAGAAMTSGPRYSMPKFGAIFATSPPNLATSFTRKATRVSSAWTFCSTPTMAPLISVKSIPVSVAPAR